jgi:hypothetical protein
MHKRDVKAKAFTITITKEYIIRVSNSVTARRGAKLSLYLYFN